MAGRVEFIGDMVKDTSTGLIGIVIGVNPSCDDMVWDYEILCEGVTYFADAYELVLAGEENGK